MAGTLHDLRLLILSRHPIISVETSEEARALAWIKNAAERLSRQCCAWNLVAGLRVAAGNGAAFPQTAKPAEALTYIGRQDWPAVFVMEELCVHLKDAGIQRHVQNFAENAASRHQTMMLIDADTDLPNALARQVVPFEFGLPNERELTIIVRDAFREQQRYCRVRSELTKDELGQLVGMLRGLTGNEAKLAVTRVILDDDCLNADDIPRLLGIKREMLHKGGLLEYVEPGVNLDSIAGLNNLKKWVVKRAGALTPKAREFGLEPPKGSLLLGVQGCGKSAACKAVAAAWGLPLLKLDPGCLYNKYVGESERNLRQAIKQAESMAPVVLWIDEIEKAFTSGGTDVADGGLSRRMFGTLLNWLQEHTSPVFCAATANDITSLPPELMRKGRFDEIFFVDLPTLAARRQIFAIHLRKRKRAPEQFDLTALAEASDGFSGAEIEQAVIASLYAAFGAGHDLTQADLLEELHGTRPLSVTMAEKVARLRAWASGRCVSAD